MTFFPISMTVSLTGMSEHNKEIAIQKFKILVKKWKQKYGNTWKRQSQEMGKELENMITEANK